MTEALAKKILDGAEFYKIDADGHVTKPCAGSGLAGTMQHIKHGEERGHVRPTQNHTAIIPLRRLVTGGAFKLFAESLR